jgi:hypothetical protein
MNSILVGKIECLIATWQRGGLPGRNELHETGNHLLEWRRRHHIPGLWQNPPLLVGATLDDAWGVGLELILKYAQILGMQTRLLGSCRHVLPIHPTF